MYQEIFPPVSGLRKPPESMIAVAKLVPRDGSPG